ncbi:MAG: MerC domain-containing protein [Candidatus Obscuribacterales bacterium]|nr:MerC domain-containing protein [Candidatus Obscuribacterales bacterium]
MATSISTRATTRWKRILDFLAVAGPIICLIDCVVLPVVSAVLPFVGMEQVSHGLINDQLVFLLILAICLPIIVPGFLKHRSKRVLGMFSAAILLMSVVNFCGIAIEEGVHMCISLLVAVLLISANRENKRLLGCGCAHQHEGAAHGSLSLREDEASTHSLTPAPEGSRLRSEHHHHDHGHHHHHHDHHGPCIHEVVVALERVESLVPDHFEPRNNLSFAPTAIFEAAQSDSAAHGIAEVEQLSLVR